MPSIWRLFRALMREIFALRSKEGPYRFLVRRWDDVSDIDLALRVLQTEFFKREIIPVPLPVTDLRSILVLSPHQDDEVIGAGGTLLLASDAGIKIEIVYITDGALYLKAMTPSQSVKVRDLEARKVCRILAAKKYDLGISNLLPQPTLDDVDRLSDIICKSSPQVIMAPWILDAPAKHRLVNHLLWLAYQRNGLPDVEIWGYQVHSMLFPNGYVDITPVAERKWELIRTYGSQIKYLYRYDHISMGMAAWNARLLPNYKGDSVARYVEIFFALPLQEFLRLIEKFYFVDLRKTYGEHDAFIHNILTLHQTVKRGNR